MGNETRHKIRELSETPHKFRLNISVLKQRVFQRIVQTHRNSRIYLRDENDVIYTLREVSFLLRIKY